MYGVREKKKNRVRGGELKIKHDEGSHDLGGAHF